MKSLALFVLVLSQYLVAGEVLAPAHVVTAAIAAAKGDDTALVSRYVNMTTVIIYSKTFSSEPNVVSLLKGISDKNVILRPLHTETTNFAAVAMHGSIELFFELKGVPTPDGLVYLIKSVEGGQITK